MTHSSVTLLCAAAIAALVSVALLGIAFSTDNWRHVAVNRPAIDVALAALPANSTFGLRRNDHRLFDRVQGIFRVCFPGNNRPVDDGEGGRLYLNPVEEWCTSIDYHVRLLDTTLFPEKMTKYGEVWFHLARSAIAGFCLYFMLMGVGCVTGFLGCWRASGDHLITTATLFLLASLSSGTAMGLWHWAQFYEMEKVFDERLNFFQTWPEFLQKSTAFSIGWSYILAWFGIGLALLSSILFSCAAICIKQEFRELEERAMMMKLRLSYPGGGAINMRSVSRKPDANYMPGTPPMNHTRRNSLVFPNYYSAGYPMQYEEADAGESRTIKYKNVVKELEDSKL